MPFILLIMVINVLSAEQNAFLFLSHDRFLMILLAILRLILVFLLAESSYNNEVLKRNVKRALKFIFILILFGLAIVAILIFFYFEEYFLLIFW